MKESRSKKSFKNIIVNNVFQFLNIILNFVIRTIFINSLGKEYLGINGLFSNILSILSLAELGVGTAMLYSMYKPIAEDDKDKITALVQYYKILYRRIALVILCLGILIIPILPYIINLEKNIGNIYLYYILYLLNSVTSYLLLYKTSIIIASQKEYLIKKYDIIFVIVRNLLQGIILIAFKNYALYLIIQISTTILTNIFKSGKAEKEYPYIRNNVELDNSEKVKIWDNIKSLLFYQVGNVILNNTDNILISVLCGTIFVGYYSNYSMIITALSGFTSLIFTSMQASIGNYNVKGSDEGKHLIYKMLNYLAFITYGFCGISLFILLQDFISLWIGNEYLLSIETVAVIVLNYYITGMLYPNWCYRYTTNLFNEAKYTIAICAVLNIILSIVLGIKLGLVGILIATGLSRLLTTFWYEPYILYKNIFNKNVREYFIRQIIYIMIIMSVTLILSCVFRFINIDNLLIRMIVKECIFGILFIIFFILLFKNSKEFVFLKEKVFIILNSKIQKKVEDVK